MNIEFRSREGRDGLDVAILGVLGGVAHHCGVIDRGVSGTFQFRASTPYPPRLTADALRTIADRVDQANKTGGRRRGQR